MDAVVCGQGAFGAPGTQAAGCRLLLLPVAPGAVVGAVALTTFVAQARGDIDGDPTIDIWEMTETKEVRQPAANDDVNL